MAISPDMTRLLNEQLNKELYSMNLYLAMASYLYEQELTGFAHFFRLQSAEENAHAQKQFDYLHDVGGRLSLGAIDAPASDFTSTLDILERTLAHEKVISASIANIVEQALAEKDYGTHTFFQWFVTEQIEEEATMNNLLFKLKRIGDNTSALYLLDDDLGKRSPEA